jgi:hypothetical protein
MIIAHNAGWILDESRKVPPDESEKCAETAGDAASLLAAFRI